MFVGYCFGGWRMKQLETTGVNFLSLEALCTKQLVICLLNSNIDYILMHLSFLESVLGERGQLLFIFNNKKRVEAGEWGSENFFLVPTSYGHVYRNPFFLRSRSSQLAVSAAWNPDNGFCIHIHIVRPTITHNWNENQFRSDFRGRLRVGKSWQNNNLSMFVERTCLVG